MKLKTLLFAAALLSPVGPATTARAQTAADFKSFLTGTARPLTLKFKDLTPAYRRFAMASQGDSFSNYMQTMMGMKGVETGVYFTTGETVTIGDETYLIAYRSTTPPDLTAVMNHGHGDPVVPLRPGPNAELSLSLLNLRNVGSLNDVRPFDPKRDMQTPSEGAAASTRTLTLLGQGMRQAIRAREDTVPQVGKTVTPEMRRRFYPYVHDGRTWRNPVDNEFYATNPAISGLNLSRVTNARYLPAFYEAKPAGDGTRGVLFLDGHVERVNSARWDVVSVVKPLLKPQAAPRIVLPARKRRDATITTPRVKSAIGANRALRGSNINITTTENYVSLDGTVRTDAQKRLAGAIARRNAPGYVIHNNLRIDR